jgi:hypothetical protein
MEKHAYPAGGGVDYLAKLFNQVLQSTQRVDIEKVQLIKKLVKDLLKEAYVNDDPQAFASILAKAIEYAIYCHQHQMPHYLSSVFEIDYQDNHFAQSALASGNQNTMIWLFLEDYDFFEHKFERYVAADKSTKFIQSFKMAVLEKMGVEIEASLPPWESVITSLNAAYKNKDAVKIKELSDLVHYHFKLRFHQMNEAVLVKVLGDYLKLCQQAFKEGEFGILVDLLWIDHKSLFDVHEALKQNRPDLMLEWYVDTFNFEENARSDESSGNEVQKMKLAIVRQLGGVARRPFNKIMSNFIDAYQRNDMRQFWMIANEVELFIRDAYIDKSTRQLREAIDSLNDFFLRLYREQRFDLIGQYLEVTQDLFDNFMLLLRHEETGLVKLKILEHLGYDGLYTKYCTDDVDYANESVVEHFKFRNMLMSAGNGVPLSYSALKGKLSSLVKTQPIDTDQLIILDLHIKTAISVSIETNHLDLLDKQIHLLAELYLAAIKSNRFDSLLMVLPLNSENRHAIILGLQKGDLEDAFLAVYAAVMNDYRFNKQDLQLSNYLDDLEYRFYEDDNPTKIIMAIKAADQEKTKAVLDFDNLDRLRAGLVDAIQSRSVAMLLEMREAIRDTMINFVLNCDDKPNNAQEYANILKILLDLCPLVIEQNSIELVEIFGGFVGGDLDAALAITEKKDVALLKWLLIYDKILINQMKDLSKSPDETMRFLQRVMQNLDFDTNELVPSYTKVLQQMQEPRANMYYHFDQLECCLISALAQNDSVTAAAVVTAFRNTIVQNPVIAQGAYAQFNNYSPEQMSLLRAMSVESGFNLLEWEILNSPRIAACLTIKGLSREQIQHAKQLVYAKMLFPKIPAMIEQTRQAIVKDDLPLCTLSAERLDDFMRECYLSNEAQSFAQLLHAYQRVFTLAVENSSLAMYLKDELMSPESWEEIQFLLSMNQPGLASYYFIESLKLGDYGSDRGLPLRYTAEFKKSVFEYLQKQYGMNVIPDEAPRFILDARKNPNAKRLQNLKIKACLGHAASLRRVDNFADLLASKCDMIIAAYERNDLNAILDNISLDLSKRDALFYFLFQKDRAKILELLAEDELQLLTDAIDSSPDKLAFKIFRANVYESLGIPLAVKGDKDVGRNYIHGDLAIEHAECVLDELMENDQSIDAVKSSLGYFAKGPLTMELVNYLKSSQSSNKREIGDYLEEMQYRHLLAHRYYLPGQTDVNGVVLELWGGIIPAMVNEITKSHTAFIHNVDEVKALSVAISEIVDAAVVNISAEDLTVVVNDIQNQLLKHQRIYSEEKSRQLLLSDNIVNVSTSVVCENKEPHAMCVSFYDDLCFDCDRSREGDKAIQGVIIYRMVDYAGIPAAINKLSESNFEGRELQQSSILAQVGLYGAQQVAVSPASMQYVGNCTWSSHAEMMLRCTAIAKFYQLGKQRGLDKDVALTYAIRAGEVYHNHVMRNDHAELIKEYLDKHANNEIKLPMATIILAIIYYKAKACSEERVCASMDQHKVFANEEDYQLKLAQGLALLAEVVLAKIPSELLDSLNPDSKIQLDVELQKLARLYLEEKYIELEEGFDNLSARLAAEKPPTPKIAGALSEERSKLFMQAPEEGPDNADTPEPPGI